MKQPAAEPQLLTIAPMLLCGIAAEGDDAGGAEHWQRFRWWLSAYGITSCDPAVLAIAYAPPVPFGSTRVVELFVPVLAAPQVDAPDAVLRSLGGRFVFASGDPVQVPALLRAARAFAAARGIAFERGSIEIYKPPQGDGDVRVDAGVRIHD